MVQHNYRYEIKTKSSSLLTKEECTVADIHMAWVWCGDNR